MDKQEIHSDSLRRFEEQPEHIEVEKKKRTKLDVDHYLESKWIDRLENGTFEPGEL